MHLYAMPTIMDYSGLDMHRRPFRPTNNCHTSSTTSPGTVQTAWRRSVRIARLTSAYSDVARSSRLKSEARFREIACVQLPNA